MAVVYLIRDGNRCRVVKFRILTKKQVKNVFTQCRYKIYFLKLRLKKIPSTLFQFLCPQTDIVRQRVFIVSNDARSSEYLCQVLGFGPVPDHSRNGFTKSIRVSLFYVHWNVTTVTPPAVGVDARASLFGGIRDELVACRRRVSLSVYAAAAAAAAGRLARRRVTAGKSCAAEPRDRVPVRREPLHNVTAWSKGGRADGRAGGRAAGRPAVEPNGATAERGNVVVVVARVHITREWRRHGRPVAVRVRARARVCSCCGGGATPGAAWLR